MEMRAMLLSSFLANQHMPLPKTTSKVLFYPLRNFNKLYIYKICYNQFIIEIYFKANKKRYIQVLLMNFI
ncbi:hypothetical protein CLH_2526 [Clostridium botulinum E3 str. Alaska E43]|nr:hypothetical protein CLH_2526 [Clostridium botulinum E3 str. Alaska E43]